MEVLESHVVSSIEDLYGICMVMKTWFFSNIWLLHTPHAPAHKKGQDMATGAEHLSVPLDSQQSRPKHYYRSVEHYEETHEKSPSYQPCKIERTDRQHLIQHPDAGARKSGSPHT